MKETTCQKLIMKFCHSSVDDAIYYDIVWNFDMSH